MPHRLRHRSPCLAASAFRSSFLAFSSSLPAARVEEAGMSTAPALGGAGRPGAQAPAPTPPPPRLASPPPPSEDEAHGAPSPSSGPASPSPSCGSVQMGGRPCRWLHALAMADRRRRQRRLRRGQAQAGSASHRPPSSSSTPPNMASPRSPRRPRVPHRSPHTEADTLLHGMDDLVLELGPQFSESLCCMIAYTKLQHLLLVLSMPLLTKLSTNGVFALSSMKVVDPT